MLPRQHLRVACLGLETLTLPSPLHIKGEGSNSTPRFADASATLPLLQTDALSRPPKLIHSNRIMGPLSGYKIIEMAGIGPAPMCAMLLADMGADVLLIDRTTGSDLGIPLSAKYDLLKRGRRSVALDLKRPEAVATVLRLIEQADALIEGFRPGVMERLGLGPDVCLAGNPRLVYGRMTGWGQEGPLAHAAGHDINYIALVGVLHAIGRKGEAPVPPLNLVGDFGGGALYLALGVVAGLLEAQKSGRGQVMDAAMIDGAASLMTLMYGLHAAGKWVEQRGANMLDSGAHYYDTSTKPATESMWRSERSRPSSTASCCACPVLKAKSCRRRTRPRRGPR